jgi:multidrug efflux pump subunit AcrA (membrane-fusion protein)
MTPVLRDPEGIQVSGLPADEPAPLRSNLWLLVLVMATLAIAVFALFEVILPAYRRPTTSTYGTRLGYPAILRAMGRPLPVQTTKAERRKIVRSILAEGTMASDLVLVPMVPMSKITGVYVQPGQRVRKGELLAELDARKGQLAADTARLAFLAATAELKRTKIGSVILENREQPERDAIAVKALHDQAGLLREEVATKEKLYDQSLVAKPVLLEAKRMLAETEQALDTASQSLEMSSPGKNQSERIAADTMQQAMLRWQEALEEVNDYKIVSPADGIVDRILVHAGEFNQTPGGPAFVVAAGLWFQGYFDQAAVGDVVEGASAEVYLAARQGIAFAGDVSNVNPIVSYSTGGPETPTPIRPIGTGAPEWPVTFKARIELSPEAVANLVPGLTGFARVTLERTSVAVPEAAMTSMSAGNGLVSVVSGSSWQVRRVRYGAATEGWVEVLDGVASGDKVMVEGQQVLQAGDRIEESSWQPPHP